MAATTAAVLIVAAAAASAYSANKQASAAEKGAKHNASEAEKQREHEKYKVELQRNSPGAKFAPFGFDSILKVFGSSMAGRMSGFNPAEAAQRMGLTNPDGSKGPLWGSPSEYMQWSMNSQGNTIPYAYMTPEMQAKVLEAQARRAMGAGVAPGGSIPTGLRGGSLNPTSFAIPSGSWTTGGGATFEDDEGERSSTLAL